MVVGKLGRLRVFGGARGAHTHRHLLRETLRRARQAVSEALEVQIGRFGAGGWYGAGFSPTCSYPLTMPKMLAMVRA